MTDATLPLTIGSGGQSGKATVDCTAVAAASSAVVDFAYAGGATDAALRACTVLYADVGGTKGSMRTPGGVLVTPVTLADFIAEGRTATVHYVAPDLFVDAVSPMPGPSLVWVTGDEILIAAGASPPSEDELEWADLVAGAINAGLDQRMRGVVVLDTADYPELLVAARLAGVEGYKRREAVFGITGYVDLQGAAIRIARDYLEGVAPIVARYATVGIA